MTSTEIAQDAVIEANRKLLLDRSNVGIRKYGVTLDRSNLTHRELLQHHLEELLDAANYVQAQIMKIDAETRAANEKDGFEPFLG